MFNQKGAAEVFANTLIGFLIIFGTFIYNSAVTNKIIPQNNTVSQSSSSSSKASSSSSSSSSASSKAANTAQNNNSQVSFSDFAFGDSAKPILSPNSKSGYNIQMTSTSDAILGADWIGEGISASLTNPNGVLIDLTKAGTEADNPLIFKQSDGKYHLTYSFKDPIVEGSWKLIISNSGVKNISFDFLVFGKTDVSATPQRDQNRENLVHKGLNFGLSVGVSQSQTTLKNMTVQARIQKNNSSVAVKNIPLFDDNYNGTGIPNDGIYNSRQVNLPVGDYEIYYLISGKNLQGKQIYIKEDKKDYVTISSDNALIVSDIKDKGISSFTEGITSTIQVEVGVKINKTGNYTLTGTVFSPNGEEDATTTPFHREANDSYEYVNLLFRGFSQLGLDNGVYKLKDLRLWDDDNGDIIVDRFTDGDDGVYTLHSYTVK